MLCVPDPTDGIITFWISYADIGVLITCSSWHSCCSCLRLDWLLCLEPDCEMVWLYIFSRWDWYLCRFANPSLARRTGENLSFGRCKEFAKEFGAKKNIKKSRSIINLLIFAWDFLSLIVIKYLISIFFCTTCFKYWQFGYFSFHLTCTMSLNALKYILNITTFDIKIHNMKTDLMQPSQGEAMFLTCFLYEEPWLAAEKAFSVTLLESHVWD